ncbi:hypothetical protein MMC10_008097 [Thelotrema lepadinum]|nr:hypothetical protein [Thelotrema lepadinum]
MRARQVLFRLFYNTTFTVLLFIEVVLLLISPGDIIYQSYQQDRAWDIIIIAGVYALTLVIALFIIATRLYTARKELLAVPRSHVPIRDGDLPRSVRKLVKEGLARSVSIAYNAHPREVRQEEIQTLEQENRDIGSLAHMKSWLQIEHPGWSSLCSSDMPNLQYEPVLLEFPNLIEAKAVSLAPPDPLFKLETSDSTDAVPPDPLIVSILQRPPSMPIRDYISRLSSLHMLDTTPTTTRFIHLYEQSRFSKQPIYESTFRTLLADFTEIMHSLRPSPSKILATHVPEGHPSRLPTPTPSPPGPPSRPSASTPSLTPSLPHSHSQLRTSPRPPLLQKPHSQPPQTHTQTPIHKNVSPSPHRPSLAPRSGTSTPHSKSQPHTPFLTPRPVHTPKQYVGSLSSGHAGDRSSDSSGNESGGGGGGGGSSGNESDSERSAHTAFTRPSVGRRGGKSKSRSRAGTSGSVGLGLGIGIGMRVDGGRSTSRELVDQNGSGEGEGSVVRRAISGGSVASSGSGSKESGGGSVIRRFRSAETMDSAGSGGSVIRREGRREEVLDLPVAFVPAEREEG